MGTRKTKQVENRVSVYDVVTERLIQALEQGVVPWRREWDAGSFQAPRSLASGKGYKGINFFILGMMSSRFSSPYWLTFRQARERGGHVRKGESGLPVFFWKIYERDAQDEAGKDQEDRRFVARYYTVFNVEQCEGIEYPRRESVTRAIPVLDACEQIVAGYQHSPCLRHGGPTAYYSPIGDVVQMPERERFTSPEGYYSILFHELAHSTGHPSRLGRFQFDSPPAPFGSPDYSKEELVAEMGSAFLCAHAGISNATIENSAAYLRGWLQTLKSDKRMIPFAAAAARKAADLILGESEADAPVEEVVAA
jgi:antirestriction protein ArdC